MLTSVAANDTTPALFVKTPERFTISLLRRPEQNGRGFLKGDESSCLYSHNSWCIQLLLNSERFQPVPGSLLDFPPSAGKKRDSPDDLFNRKKVALLNLWWVVEAELRLGWVPDSKRCPHPPDVFSGNSNWLRPWLGSS